MPDEDLLQWKQETRERIDTLQRYDYTLRTVQGRLNQLTYNVNSSITRMADERKVYRDLEKQLRETKRAFKQDFPDVPCSLGGIERAISHYESIQASIDRQLENQERLSHLEHRPTTQGWSDLVAEAARRLAPEEPPPPHTAQKRPLRDHYNTDTEPTRQHDEPDRSR